MSRKISNESAGFLFDELSSIINMLRLGLLALENEEDDLIPTALETAFLQLQNLLDLYCINRDLTKEKH